MEYKNIYNRTLLPLEQYIIDVFHILFTPSGSIHIYPEISQKVRSKAQTLYLDLKPDELLIAIFDDAAGDINIKKGFAFTTRRVYWKNDLERPKVAEYKSLGGPFRFGETLIMSLKKLDLGDGRKIDVPNYRESHNLFVEFLDKAGTAYKQGIPDKTSTTYKVVKESKTSTTIKKVTVARADTAYEGYWLLTATKERFGPYTIDALRKNLNLLPNAVSLIWKEGMPGWLPVEQVPEIDILLKQKVAKRNPNISPRVRYKP